MDKQDANTIVQEIQHRLSLRSPQAKSLEILNEVLNTLLPAEYDKIESLKNADVAKQLETISGHFPQIKNFDRQFLSLCFALATGVGKTRLMGAFITLLFKVYGVKNFMVIAPNLTIYNKLRTDFTPGTPKYVFKGIDVFNQRPPILVTGDNYQSGVGVRDDWFSDVKINIFNISKLTARETKGDHLEATDARKQLAKIRRISETIGESYFDYLANCKDLVVIMDESHRYRAEAGAQAIDDLKPILGLELTATPQVIRGQRAELFRNIIYAYDLPAAMNDGFVKEPAIGSRKGFRAENYANDPIGLEHLKLNDGIFFHERTKLELANYAQNHNLPIVKPFMLVVADDKAHADELEMYLTSSAFKNGEYAGKVIKIYSGMKAEEEEKMIGQLLEIEKADNPAEIVIHVNKLSEGWDVTNLYTIVPLRAANSVNLVEQSIGRGLRLPYGRRVGDSIVDTLTVVSHDNYAKIVKRAEEGLSLFKQKIEIGDEKTPEVGKKAEILTPAIEAIMQIGQQAKDNGDTPVNIQNVYIPQAARKTIDTASSEAIGALSAVKRTMDAMASSSTGCDTASTEIQQRIVEKVNTEQELAGKEQISAQTVKEAIKLASALTIEIPRIQIKPKNQVRCGYEDFELNTDKIPTNPIDDAIIQTKVGSDDHTSIYSGAGAEISNLSQLKSDIIRGLSAMSDIDYDDCAELLHKLVDQVVDYLDKKLSDEKAINNILRNYQGHIIAIIHEQVIAHAKFESVDYDTKVLPGYFTLTQNSIAIDQDEVPRDYRKAIQAGDKDRITSMVFTGFSRCLYKMQKFDSDSERSFARVLEDSSEVQKWFKPALTNFRIAWRGPDGKGAWYSPDFIVEANSGKYICEVKSTEKIESEEVKAKMAAALQWCHYASHGIIPANQHWHYLLIPHDQIDANLFFDIATKKFEQK